MSKGNGKKEWESYRGEFMSLSKGHWYALHRPLVWGLGPIDGLILSAIIDKGARCLEKRWNESKTTGKFTTQWFYYTTESLRIDTGVEYLTQKRSIDRLTEKGFITTKRWGWPPLRYLSVDIKAVVNAKRGWTNDMIAAKQAHRQAMIKRIKDKWKRRRREIEEVQLLD